jgi:O-antigen/teichoic acid export membrane protein
VTTVETSDKAGPQPRRFPWIRRGSAALADQGLFAIGNFILNILLARWLSPREYGGFSVAFATFLLLGTLHTALLTEPMLVFGSGKRSRQFPAYIRTLLRIHWQGSAVAAVVLLAVAAFAASRASSPFSGSLVAFAVVAPVILLTWLARRACYARLRPDQAAIGGGAYLASMLAILWSLHHLELVTPVSAVLAMGGAGLVSLLVLLPMLGIRPIDAAGTRIDPSVARDHWRYGRWALGTAVLGWVPSNLFVLVLPLRSGLEASGAFRALLNLFLPMMQATSALAILALPVLVRAWADDRSGYAARVGKLVIAFAFGAAAYGSLVAIFGGTLIDWLYDGRYMEYATAVKVLAGVPALAGIAAVLGSALRAVERPEIVFRAYLAPTLTAGSAGTLLAYTSGVGGASLGWLLTYAAAAAFLLLAFSLWWSRNRVDRVIP